MNKRISAVIALVVSVLAIAVPRPASAASTVYRFTGGGFGHGAGMSQWGAKGGADAGRNYIQILQHYYKGTQIQVKTMPASIRVGLIQNTPKVDVNGNGRFDFQVDGKTVFSGAKGDSFAVKPTSTGAYAITGPQNKTVGKAGGLLAVRFEQYNTVLGTLGNHHKYGWLEIRSTKLDGKYGLRAVMNIKPFERYLYGIAEVPSSWPMEALKAQAVASRTYAVEHMGRLGQISTCSCHVYDDTRSQVYAGYDKLTGTAGSRWKAAVDATAGKVATYNGKLIQALYSSSSGGHTENNEFVFGGAALSYLRGVDDPWDKISPNYRWTVSLEKAELEKKLNAEPKTKIGTLISIKVLNPRGVSRRITPVIDSTHGGLQVTGSSRSVRIGGATFRKVVGLKSSLFDIHVDQT